MLCIVLYFIALHCVSLVTTQPEPLTAKKPKRERACVTQRNELPSYLVISHYYKIILELILLAII
jgi:hypothetical protein